MDRTHVILTVGLSEIPVLVGAFRLCCWGLERDGRLPTFSVLCRDDTTDEAQRVYRLLESRLRGDSLLGHQEVLRWTQFVVPYSKPQAIRQAVANMIRLQPPDCVFHLHYSGGSRAMSVNAMEALSAYRYEDGRACELETSFLPTGENVIVHSKRSSTADERASWALSVSELAELNGFATEYFSTQCNLRVTASKPDPALVELGCDLFTALQVPENRRVYADWLQSVWTLCWDSNSGRAKRRWARWPQTPPKESWPKQPIQWMTLPNYPNWELLTTRLRDHFGGGNLWCRSDSGWALHLEHLVPADLGRLNQFLQYQCLELFAYRSLREALERAGHLKWNVYHSIRVAKSAPNATVHRDFELDVVAVLGYELLVISCSLSADQAALKRKAFEVLHRAKQVGGNGARSLLLCALFAEEARRLQRDVEEDTGPREKNLEILGKDAFRDLPNRIAKYLSDL